MNIISYNQYNFITCEQLNQLGLKVIMTTSPLSMGPFRNLDKDDLMSNLNMVRALLNSNKPFYFMHQKHTNQFKDTSIDKPITHDIGYYYENIDALIDHENHILFSTYADCTPIIIFDAAQKIQANCHSGWRGTHQGILDVLLNHFINHFNSDPNDIHILIGPHLLFDDFEVTKEVYDLFKEKYPDPKYYNQKDKQHYCIDTLAINLDFIQYHHIPQHQIYILKESTLTNPHFHSFRRDKENFKQMAIFSMIK